MSWGNYEKAMETAKKCKFYTTAEREDSEKEIQEGGEPAVVILEYDGQKYVQLEKSSGKISEILYWIWKRTWKYDKTGLKSSFQVRRKADCV